MADNPHIEEADLRSVLQKMQERRAEAERQDAIADENKQEWREAANRIFSSRDGKLFIKYLLRASGLFRVDSTRDMTKMLEDRGTKNVYLSLIRPYLTPELLMELENQK